MPGMGEVLLFFKNYEVWIYLFLGLGGLVYLTRFVQAWEDMRQAIYGLERESAQLRLNGAATGLVLLLIMAVGEFSLVSFIIPSIPGATPLLTPTLDLLATPTTTLSAPTTPQPNLTLGGVTSTLAVSGQPTSESGCIPNQVMITKPDPGSTVGGIVVIEGTADISNFGFYKFEISKPGEPNWLAIQAWTEPKKNTTLGQWDTSRLDPGLYLLRLVVIDNQGQSSSPCVIQVNITKQESQ